MASLTVAYATFITGNPSLPLYMYILYSNHNPRILIMRVIFIYVRLKARQRDIMAYNHELIASVTSY